DPGADAPRMRIVTQPEPAAPLGAPSLETLVALWPRIKDDVKAVNRRAEALLAEADPAQISGNRITIVAAYEFHREKLNSSEVRELLQDTIARHLGMPVTVNAALRNETLIPAPSRDAAPSAATYPEESPSDPSTLAETGPEEGDRFRIQAARNIFDADILDGDPRDS
ncbi:MAG: hypothetical protein ACKOWF_14715, partial [Chloroflexota bacterium]